MGQIKEKYHEKIVEGFRLNPYEVKALYPKVTQEPICVKIKKDKIKHEGKKGL